MYNAGTLAVDCDPNKQAIFNNRVAADSNATGSEIQTASAGKFDFRRGWISGNTDGVSAVGAAAEMTLSGSVKIDGGAQLPMYKVIATSIRTSKVRRISDDWQTDFLTVAEGYYLGTTSGHRYFGSGAGFAVGDPLHAIVVDDGDFPEASHLLNVEERFERIIYMTHRHNIVSVWSDGREVVRRGNTPEDVSYAVQPRVQ